MSDSSWEEIQEQADRQLARRQLLYEYGKFESIDQQLEFARRMNDTRSMVEDLCVQGQNSERIHQKNRDEEDDKDDLAGGQKKIKERQRMWSTCKDFLGSVHETTHSLELQHHMIEKFKKKFDRLLDHLELRSPKWAVRSEQLKECAAFFKALRSAVDRTKKSVVTSIKRTILSQFDAVRTSILKEKFGARSLNELSKDEKATVWAHIVQTLSPEIIAEDAVKVTTFVGGACKALKGSLITVLLSQVWGLMLNKSLDVEGGVHDVLQGVAGFMAIEAAQGVTTEFEVDVFAGVGETLGVSADIGEMTALIVGTAGEAILLIGAAVLFDVIWGAITGLLSNQYMPNFVSGPVFVVRDSEGDIAYD